MVISQKRFKKELYQIISTMIPLHGAVSTISQTGKPQVAVMGYTIASNLTMLLNTDSRSRKWANIKNNPHIALAIGWDGRQPFVQIEGVATLITKQHRNFEEYEKNYFAKHSNSLVFKNVPTSVFIQVTPTWIKLTDPRTTPVTIEEYKL